MGDGRADSHLVALELIQGTTGCTGVALGQTMEEPCSALHCIAPGSVELTVGHTIIISAPHSTAHHGPRINIIDTALCLGSCI
jgi:hypothetical protein